MPAVTVVTPVYNVDRFIEKCAVSLMNQTLHDVEFIFVDDASTDDSICKLQHILDEYPWRDARIIHHQSNMGLPASRRTGIGIASGDFVFNCDGDDWVEVDMLEKLYSAVLSKNADYAYCDFFLSYNHSERRMSCPQYDDPDEMLRKGFLCGSAKYNVWNKLIRRTLYDGAVFPVDHKRGGEDMIMIEVLSKAKGVAYVPEPLYHYVKTNNNAISESFSNQRLIDIKYNADHAISFLLANYKGNLTDEIACFKLNVKLPFLISDEDIRHNIWREWYPEANEYATKNPFVSFRIRMLQLCARMNLWFIVSVHYWIVYKVVYRLLYR